VESRGDEKERQERVSPPPLSPVSDDVTKPGCIFRKCTWKLLQSAMSTNHNLKPLVNPSSLKIAGSTLGQQQQQLTA